jgi:cell division septal protein FtsQ
LASKKTHSLSRSEVRMRRRRRTLISLGIILTLALSFPLWSPWMARLVGRQIVSASDHFRVKNTVVLGNRVVPLQQILSLAAVRSDACLLTVPVGAVKTRIQKHPWIRYAYVRRRLPDTIEIRVTEREPVAAVRGDGFFMITSDSVAVSPLTSNWVWDLPILTPPHPLRLKAGMAVTDTATLALLHETLVLRNVSQTAWHNLSELYYESDQMHAELTQPAADILIGRGVTELSWTGALKLLSDNAAVKARNHTLLDLRIPGKVIVSENFRTSDGQVNG